MSEVLKQILNWVSMFLGSALGGAIIGGILGGFFKGKTEKFTNKVNVEKIAKTTVEETVGQVKKVSFEQSIQPVVESELEKVNEKADIRLRKTVRELKENDEKIINILEKFICYFDYSIGVPDEVKSEAKKAVAEAKGKEEVINVQEIKIVEEQPKKEVEVKEDTNVQR